MSETFEQIGKYKILGKIGQGAMGEVWRALDPVLNRHVAIKTIAAAGSGDETLRKRFLREAQSAAHLNHPNIITVYDYGEEYTRIYMAMELLEGRDLKDLIVHHTLTEIHDKLDVMEQICDGLAYAHAKDVVHRDLKPGNIHVQPGGQVKIMDFGLARLGSSDMTREGIILGTPNYMSPEQVRGEKADARSDIFSLGAVFYELLTNHKPFDADSLHAVLFNVLQHDPEPMRTWAPDVPPILVDVVERALLKDPAERYQNGADLREELRAVRRKLAEGWVGEPTVAMEQLVGDVDEPPPALDEPAQPANRSRASASSSGTLSRPSAPRSAPGAAAVVDGTGALTASVAQRRTGSSASLRRGASTMSGRAVTAPVPVQAPEPAPPSRLPLYLGGAVAVAGIALAAYFALRTAPPPPDKGRVTPVRESAELVDSKIQLGARALADKDYQGAVAQAERALALDPTNGEARALLEKARAAQAQVDAAAAEAKAALDAGDLERAAKALATVMSLDPRHPVAGELSQKLGSRFRAQADEAKKLMVHARAAAERAGATSLAPFGEGAGLVREADGFVARGDFAVATQRYLTARDRFESAAREAEQRRAAHTPPPTTAPPATSIAASLPPVTIAPATPPPTQPPATLPPATQAPVTAPPATAAPATLPASDEPAIRRVVADYGRAIETQDLGLFRTLKPNLSADEERRLQEAFRGIKAQQVTIQVLSVQITGTQATVKVSRRDQINGSPVNTFQQTFTLVKGPSGWTIKDIGR